MAWPSRSSTSSSRQIYNVPLFGLEIPQIDPKYSFLPPLFMNRMSRRQEYIYILYIICFLFGFLDVVRLCLKACAESFFLEYM